MLQFSAELTSRNDAPFANASTMRALRLSSLRALRLRAMLPSFFRSGGLITNGALTPETIHTLYQNSMTHRTSGAMRPHGHAVWPAESFSADYRRPRYSIKRTRVSVTSSLVS